MVMQARHKILSNFFIHRNKGGGWNKTWALCIHTRFSFEEVATWIARLYLWNAGFRKWHRFSWPVCSDDVLNPDPPVFKFFLAVLFPVIRLNTGGVCRWGISFSILSHFHLLLPFPFSFSAGAPPALPFLLKQSLIQTSLYFSFFFGRCLFPGNSL